MPYPETQLLLKILSGPHVGAEILLPSGEYTLGRADHCDIIVSDQTVALVHAQLTVTATGVWLRPLEQPVSVAGVGIEQAGIPLQRLQVITLGTTRFTLGVEADDWSQLQNLELEVLNSSSFSPTSPTSSTFGDAFSKRKLQRQGMRLIKLYPWGGIALLLCCMLIVINQGNTKPIQPASINALTPVERVERVINQLSLTDLQVLALEDGSVKLQGYVENTVQQRQLEEALQPLAGKVQKRLWIQDHLVESVGAVLAVLGLRELEVRDGGPGIVVVQGCVPDEDTWHQALATLRRDMPQIVRIDDQKVETLTQRVAILHELLAQQGLHEKLTVKLDADRVVIQGALDSEEMSRYEQVITTFKTKYKNKPRLYSKTTQIRHQMQLSIRSVSVGAVPYLVTQEGKKYMEGGRLPNGYTLKSIQSGKLVLSRNDVETIYYLRSK